VNGSYATTTNFGGWGIALRLSSPSRGQRWAGLRTAGGASHAFAPQSTASVRATLIVADDTSLHCLGRHCIAISYVHPSSNRWTSKVA
jgi:hypothetical protein